jgi:ferredoxin
MSHETEHAGAALEAALAVLDEPLPGPGDFVSYDVRRCVLLAGPTVPVLELARALRHEFDVVAVIDGPRPEARLLGIGIVSAHRVTVTGYLGQFSAAARDGDGRPVDLAAKSTNGDGCFDLVIDLSPAPLIDRPVPPLGYLRPGDTAQNEAALASLTSLSGEIRKPKYFHFEPARCVHRRQRVAGCDRCLDVCPAAAITTDKRAIKVDAHLCRGCGTCTVVCPTGALTHADPAFDDVVERLDRALQVFRSAGGVNPWVGFYADDPAPITGWAADQGIPLLPLAVSSVSSVGLETLFAVLGLGAAGAVLSVPEGMPGGLVSTLTRHVDLAKTILEGLGQPRSRVSMLYGEAAEQGLVVTPQLHGPPADPVWSYPSNNPDPRARLLTVFDRLSSQSCPRPKEGYVDLPGWATFGAVTVDSNVCTMCLACTSLCPTGALSADRTGAELGFLEATCVQCGLCEHGCPEGAISRRSRFDYRALRRKNVAILNRARMTNCTQCAQPFMSTALLASALKCLSGDGAAVTQARQMLDVCPRCRGESALQAQFPSIPRRPK